METKHPTPRSKIINPVILIALAAITSIICARNISAGGLSWSDAPLHTMDGVFIHDLLIEQPIGSLKTWAQQFYLKHQCLGIVVYYPPLFAAFESVIFLLAGVSIFAARLAVLIFAIAAVWLIYGLTARMFGRLAGITAAILTISTPAGVEWATQVMLEWPATFFILLALIAYLRCLDKPNWTNAILLGLGILGAYLTKQTAAFVLAVVLLDIVCKKRWLILSRPSVWAPSAIALLIIAAYALATSSYNQLAPQLIAGTPPFRHLADQNSWFWYLRELPSIVGWPMLSGLILGFTVIVTTITKQRKTGAIDIQIRYLSLPVIWFGLWLLISSIFAAKEARYFFFAVPAMAIVTAAGLAKLDRQKQWGLGSVALFILCSIQGVSALRQPIYRLPDMQPTVNYLAQQEDADLVLVDAVRDGQFIFDVRTNPKARNRIIPMRASKFLYSRAARTKYDYQAHINTTDQLFDWIDQLGIRYIVIEDRLPATTDQSWDPPPRSMLRDTLQDQQRFQQVFSQTLAGNHPHWQKVNLLTFSYLKAQPRTTNTIKVRIPAMNREWTLTLPTSDRGTQKNHQ
ncbi:MAG: ArnT family glycosyltransferase [Planctomycetota bacterium]